MKNDKKETKGKFLNSKFFLKNLDVNFRHDSWRKSLYDKQLYYEKSFTIKFKYGTSK